MKTKPCKIEGCPNMTGMSGTAHGLCKAHYLRWYKHGRIETIKAPYGGGTIDAQGYRKIMVNGKQVREHRYVMEQILGRPLAQDEHIHHIDGNKLNNHPDNLKICTKVEHRKEHATFRNETHKECSRCHCIKPRWEFGPAKAKNGRTETHDPNSSYCYECKRIWQREHGKELWQKQKAREAAKGGQG